jgi:hypothetical protein
LWAPRRFPPTRSRAPPLDIYVVDVEGGNGTLFVAPSGRSLLIDTGNANGAVRDAERIFAAKDGLTQIDHLDPDALPRRSFRRHGGEACEAYPD